MRVSEILTAKTAIDYGRATVSLRWKICVCSSVTDREYVQKLNQAMSLGPRADGPKFIRLKTSRTRLNSVLQASEQPGLAFTSESLAVEAELRSDEVDFIFLILLSSTTANFTLFPECVKA